MSVSGLRGRNLGVLGAVRPELAARLAVVVPGVERGRTGLPTFRVDGRYVHSPYDPVREAERQWGASGYGGQSTVVLLGVGAGYVLRVLAGSSGPRRFLLVEERPEFLAVSLEVVDYAALAEGRSLAVCLGPELPDFAALLSGVEAKDLFVFEHPVLCRGEYYGRVKEALRLHLRRVAAEANTEGYFAFPWFLNSCLNLRWLEGSQDLSALEGVFAGRPAAVVAAGPSLEGRFGLLRDAAFRGVVVVAAAAALARLRAAGVVPQFVVSTDAGWYNSWNTREGLGDGRTLLVADLSVHHKALSVGHRRVAFFDFGLGYGRCLRDYAGLLPRFTMGGTVSSSCVELARFLGCGPVVLFGQDFGYPGMVTHCRGTVYGRWAMGVQGRLRSVATLEAEPMLREGLVWVEDGGGRRVASSTRLLLYRDWFAARWRGVRTASDLSVATEGLAVDDGQALEGRWEDPFGVMEGRAVRLEVAAPVAWRRSPGELAEGIEGVGDVGGLEEVLGAAVWAEVSRALAREVRLSREAGRIVPELRVGLRRALRVLEVSWRALQRREAS